MVSNSFCLNFSSLIILSLFWMRSALSVFVTGLLDDDVAVVVATKLVEVVLFTGFEGKLLANVVEEADADDDDF